MKKILSDNSGYVLVLALVIMSILVVIGIAAMRTSNIDKMISISEINYKQTLYAAESCVEMSRNVLFLLRADDTTNIDNLLQSNSVGAAFDNATTLDGAIAAVLSDVNINSLDVSPAGSGAARAASYTTTLQDNNDDDGNNGVDTDGIIVLTCTGTLGTGQVQIRANLSYGGSGGAGGTYSVQKGGDPSTSSGGFN